MKIKTRVFVLLLGWLVMVNAIARQTGEVLYQKCIACHTFGYNRTGPDHCNLIGRLAGSLDDFTYTEAMRSSKMIWTIENLDHFLEAPLDVVPGTSMGFIGIDDADERNLLITYIQTQQISEECN